MLDSSLAKENAPSFKKAVFIIENAFLDNKLAYDDFEQTICNLGKIVITWMRSNSLTDYKANDSAQVLINLALSTVLTDTIPIKRSEDAIGYIHPYTYDFDDFFGEKDWEKMFVTKLLATRKGNCHSLPYLYKILADEFSVTNAWLSFAPNHIYIKNYSKKTGWYNTELTSGQFPTDAWVMASGYVSADAIRSGIYMDTLSNTQAIANCALDLAKGYERKYRICNDSFIVKCCDLTLKYHPNSINAIIYKAETLRKMYFIYRKDNPALAARIYPDMERLYVKAIDLGYKEMPEKMYREWLLSVTKQKGKYLNKKVSNTLGKQK